MLLASIPQGELTADFLKCSFMQHLKVGSATALLLTSMVSWLSNAGRCIFLAGAAAAALCATAMQISIRARNSLLMPPKYCNGFKDSIAKRSRVGELGGVVVQ